MLRLFEKVPDSTFEIHQWPEVFRPFKWKNYIWWAVEQAWLTENMIKLTLFLLFSLNFQSILVTKGARKIETINNQSGTKTYIENFYAKSFSQLSASVASSQMSCALDCRRVDGCQSFKWTPEDNSCRMGGRITEFEYREGDSDPVFIEMSNCKCSTRDHLTLC